MAITIPELIDRLLETGIAEKETIVPCTKAEVEFLEQTVGLKLPRIYVDFLLTAGKCAGLLLDDVRWLYPELLETTKIWNEDLDGSEDCGGLVLPKTAFVCGDRCEQCQFFDAMDQSCRVFHYMERHKEFTDLQCTFFDVLDEESLALGKSIREWPDCEYRETNRVLARERAERLRNATFELPRRSE